MDFEILPTIESPHDVQALSAEQSVQLAAEIREALCQIVSTRPAHFASNLGVVELCIALHQVFDFSQDRLIWDTGHQIYPHKLVTGRFSEFNSIRTKGGLMGYPNPEESPYDLFMTGHAGASLSTVLGLKAGDDLNSESSRRAVAVIGDGALPSGIVFEAMNNAAGLQKDLLVILNDNKMGICPRVGGLAEYLDKARVTPFYNGLKRDISWILNKVPVVGESVENVLANLPGIEEVAVIGLPDADWGEIVCAVIVPAKGGAPSLADLQKHCDGRLAGYKHPRQVEVRERLPRTAATGQVQRALLVQEILSAPSN